MHADNTNMIDFIAKVAAEFEKKSRKGNTIFNYKNYLLQANECMFVLDFSKNKLLYCKGFENTWGYNDRQITLKLVLENIHPEEMDLVNRIARLSILYCMENNVNCENNLLHMTYRCRKSDGSYAKFLSQSVTIKTNPNGTMMQSMIKLTDISFMDKSSDVYWSFDAPGLDKEAFKKLVYINQENFFTKREQAVLHEIDKGLTNNEIAAVLNLSAHTISTHRKHILKKSKCHNAQELMVFCKANGFL